MQKSIKIGTQVVVIGRRGVNVRMRQKLIVLGWMVEIGLEILYKYSSFRPHQVRLCVKFSRLLKGSQNEERMTADSYIHMKVFHKIIYWEPDTMQKIPVKKP